MKRNRINKLLLAGTILLTASSSALAAEPLRSPRHQAFAESLRKRGAAPGDKIDRRFNDLSPRYKEFKKSLRKAGSPPGDKIDRGLKLQSPRAAGIFGRARKCWLND